MANSSLGLSKDVTPNDSNELPEFNWLMVTGTAGDVTLELKGGSTPTLSDVPVGVWIPCGNAIKVMSTGTAAVGIMVV